MKTWDPVLLGITFRDMLPDVLKANDVHGRVIEVGTYRGDFAVTLAEKWPEGIVCIDPWKDLSSEEYLDGCANGGREGGRIDMREVFRDAMQRLSRFGKRVMVMCDRSDVAVKAFEDGSCAAVYIDANHAHPYALNDLRLWWPKVKPGGILGIHDCYTRIDKVQNANVADAVWDFAHEIGMRPFLTSCTSAWFRRP